MLIQLIEFLSQFKQADNDGHIAATTYLDLYLWQLKRALQDRELVRVHPFAERAIMAVTVSRLSDSQHGGSVCAAPLSINASSAAIGTLTVARHR
jgi:hypothetical protein